ncbi:hypothetical protein chiPu_0032636 [Chiloscyllium punctatum]|uniref:Uncharacterized protein n=1 Tax=Chiloscyllium punctatum TaxID=137246 RepID=A0A401U178_CHIPU|nr:hypothetical protein [Chiloscyllium punctatum]
MLCFSSSRWPLVVSRGTLGALPGPLWLLLSSGTGWMVFVFGFVIIVSVTQRDNAAPAGGVPETRLHNRPGPTASPAAKAEPAAAGADVPAPLRDGGRRGIRRPRRARHDDRHNGRRHRRRPRP